MKTLHIFIILVLISNTILGQQYNLINKKTSISWTGKAAFNAYSLTGSLKAKSGFIKLQNDSIIKLEVEIDMKSLDHKNSNLKNHLRNKDFFEVKKYKTARFKLISPVIIKNNKAVLIGEMSIKSTTKKEEIKIELIKKDNLLIKLTTIIDRTEYDVKFNSPSVFKKMKENAIADEFILECKLVFN